MSIHISGSGFKKKVAIYSFALWLQIKFMTVIYTADMWLNVSSATLPQKCVLYVLAYKKGITCIGVIIYAAEKFYKLNLAQRIYIDNIALDLEIWRHIFMLWEIKLEKKV